VNSKIITLKFGSHNKRILSFLFPTIRYFCGQIKTMINRNEILSKLHQTLDQKIQYFQNLIEDLRASNTDTKSSMGDKYETSREMLQQEIMQLQRQLDSVLMQKSVLNKVKEPIQEKITFGSIVKTS